MANYVNMDPTLVRVLTVVISLFTGVPVILYLIALFVIPEEGAGSGPTNYPPVNPPQYGQPDVSDDFSGPTQPSYAPVPGAPTGANPHYGSAHGSAGGEDALWGTEGAPWEQRQQNAGEASAGPVPEAPASSAPAETAGLGATTPAQPATESVPAPEGEQTPPSADETSSWETTGSDPEADGGAGKPKPTHN